MNAANPFHLVDEAVHQARKDSIDESEQTRAQEQLVQHIRDRGKRTTRRMGSQWALALPLLAATLGITLWLGGLVSGNGGAAFAAVKQYFLHFETLRTHMQISVAGQPAMEMDILVDDRDRARIEMPGVMTTIVNGREGWMLTLLPSKAMQWTEFEPGQSAAADQLEWLYEIRDFQGQAVVLRDLRTVNGELARGYELNLDGSTMTLWATESDNRPLRMEGEYATDGSDQGVHLVLDFAFDVPLPDGSFEPEIPDGYFWLGEPPLSLD